MKILLVLFMIAMLFSSCEADRLHKLEESKKDSLMKVDEVSIKIGDTLLVNKYPNSKFAKTGMTFGYIMNEHYRITTDNHNVIQKIDPMEPDMSDGVKIIIALLSCTIVFVLIKFTFFD
jgi:hypothetical protein